MIISQYSSTASLHDKHSARCVHASHSPALQHYRMRCSQYGSAGHPMKENYETIMGRVLCCLKHIMAIPMVLPLKPAGCTYACYCMHVQYLKYEYLSSAYSVGPRQLCRALINSSCLCRQHCVFALNSNTRMHGPCSSISPAKCMQQLYFPLTAAIAMCRVLCPDHQYLHVPAVSHPCASSFSSMCQQLLILITNICLVQGPFIAKYEPVTSSAFSYGVQRLDHAVGNVANLQEAMQYVKGFTGTNSNIFIHHRGYHKYCG
jgi:hypothetical protein